MPDVLFQLERSEFDCPCLGGNPVLGTPLAVPCPLEEGYAEHVFSVWTAITEKKRSLYPFKSGLLRCR